MADENQDVSGAVDATRRQVRMAQHPPNTAQRSVGRALRATDIECLAGTGALTPELVAETQTRVESVAPRRAGDLDVVAVNQLNAAAAFTSWSGSAQRLMRRGKDAADLALLEVLERVDWIAARFSRVVLATGDHVFAPVVTALKAAGVVVELVAPRGGTAWDLYAAADTVHWIDRPAYDLALAA